MIYIDTSAILKLLHREAETDALIKHLDAQGNQAMVTSSLATVEVSRALAAIGAIEIAGQAVPSTDRVVLPSMIVIPAIAITPPVLNLARTVPPTVLRTLDAIHIATAIFVGDDLDHLISYDKRMMTAAQAAGLRATAPA